MPRIYQPGHYQVNDTIVLSANASQHLSTVLRLKEGHEVSVFSDDGYEFKATITHIHKQKISLLLLEKIEKQTESSLRIHLIQGISKTDRMDWAIQKAVELGVHRMTPVLTQHGSIKHDPVLLTKKYHHWKNIIISACEQSGRTQIPCLDEPCLFKKALDGSPVQHGWILDPRATESLQTACKKQQALQQVSLIIGPEGGLHPSEITLAHAFNYHSAHLGPRILRTETASTTALSLLQAMFGDLNNKI